jgi:F-type H+-transporting ATPase subunit delta
VASGAAKRYAQAVLELAKERGTFDVWEADLARLSEMMSNPTAVAFFANPGVPTEQKDEVLQQVLANAQPETRNLARVLTERGRLDEVPQIFALYEDGLRAERGIVVADVTTAEPLGPDEQALVGDRLAELVGKGVQLRLHVDPGIIGGIIARVGDQLIDGSVVSNLRRLRARLASSA